MYSGGLLLGSRLMEEEFDDIKLQLSVARNLLH
jgi:hypothetical protein